MKMCLRCGKLIRADELMEVTENLNAIRKFLKKNGVVHQVNSQNPRPQNQPEVGSIRQIADWLKANISAGNPTGSNQYKELSTGSTIPTLSDIGITRDESSKAQKIADLNEKEIRRLEQTELK